jgi:hypothetical protein
VTPGQFRVPSSALRFNAITRPIPLCAGMCTALRGIGAVRASFDATCPLTFVFDPDAINTVLFAEKEMVSVSGHVAKDEAWIQEIRSVKSRQ